MLFLEHAGTAHRDTDVTVRLELLCYMVLLWCLFVSSFNLVYIARVITIKLFI